LSYKLSPVFDELWLAARPTKNRPLSQQAIVAYQKLKVKL